jgi:hypothetical protein
MPPSQIPEPPPTREELVKALHDLFYVATQCTSYHYAFATLFPEAAVNGTEVHPNREQRLMLNAISEATLMFVRKSAEFFKPHERSDKPDTVYSYRYPGYTQQEWIIPQETYREFHKRVGHITIREARYGKLEWPVFPLAIQAVRKWVEFFGVVASAYAATDPGAMEFCMQCATAMTKVGAAMERDVALAEKMARG